MAPRAEYEAQLKARRDLHAKVAYAYDDGLSRGREEGLSRGREQGRAEEREQFVRNLLRRSMPIEEIAAIAELPVEQVRALSVRNADFTHIKEQRRAQRVRAEKDT